MPRSWGHRTLRVAGGWRSAPLAFRPASFARRVGSKLGQALPQHLWPIPNQHVSSYNPRPLAPILSNLARNSPAAPSNIEFASLELQRFPAVSKNYRLKLCARFVWARPAIACRRRGQALPPPTGTSAWSGSRGLSGAFFRVHHFAPQAAAPMPLLSAIASRTKAIEVGTGVIDMR